jgi:hypothetical protein
VHEYRGEALETPPTVARGDLLPRVVDSR